MQYFTPFKTIFILFILFTSINTIGLAQHGRVLVANGGIFGKKNNMVTIGTKEFGLYTYKLFDSLPGNSVDQILIGKTGIYLVVDTTLVKYTDSSLSRTAMVHSSNLRYAAEYINQKGIGYIIATKGDTGKKLLNIEIYSSDSLRRMKQIKLENWTEGVVVVGDTAYASIQGTYPNYNNKAKIAVIDLTTFSFKRYITFKDSAKGFGRLVTDGRFVIGCNDFVNSIVSIYDTKNGKIRYFKGGTSIFAANRGLLYFSPSSNIIGSLKLSTFQIDTLYKTKTGYADAAIDTNPLFLNTLVYTTPSFTTNGKLFENIGKFTDSVTVGISPQAVAIEEGLLTGIEPQTLKESAIHFYPNPASTIAFVSGFSPCEIIQIYNLQGQIIQTFKSNGGTEELNLEGLAKGMYFLRSTTSQGLKFQIR